MDAETVRNVAKDTELFKDLDPSVVEALIDRGDIRFFSPGEVIYRKGEAASGTIGLIASGNVQVVAESGYVVRELGPGEMIGEVGTVSPQGKRTVTLTVVEPTEVMEWRIADVEETLPELLNRLKDLAWKRLKYYSE